VTIEAVDDPAVHAEVEAAFWEYERALTSNDLATLDRLFWADARTVRYGPTETLVGIDDIRAFRAARPAGDLAREVEHLVVATFGADTGVASAEFRRASSGRTGRQMQTWVRMPQGWRVVAAHVSFLAEPVPADPAPGPDHSEDRRS
jgi:ketosteroid isomerase-like protein